MPTPEFFVVGITHVDLAWKRGRDEMSEMLEIVVIRLLDMLEQDADFRYHIEQASHFRALAKRRPDLIARLAPFLRDGRLEFVGGMASTVESNLPGGESFIRNQQMGLQWVAQTWGSDVPVTTGWLVDTFGIPPQTPQILQGFGLTRLLANRFGGAHTRDLFRAKGLDGSEVTVAGWGTYAGYIRPENLAEQFCKNWDDIDRCFAKADTLTGPGPFMVIPYTENEMLVSGYSQTLTKQRNADRSEQHWHAATPRDFFDALAETGRTLPVVDGDLNPEFTGCFSLRHLIRVINRRVETRLLEAEKWSALGETGSDSVASLEEAWWQLAYVQFHDVFTGSHPTVVYHDVLQVLGEVEAAADAALAKSFAQIAPPLSGKVDKSKSVVTVFNGLPWTRTDVAEFLLPEGWAGIARVTDSSGADCLFTVKNGKVHVSAAVPATGCTAFQLFKGDKEVVAAPVAADTTALENEWIRLDFDRTHGVGKLIWKPTGAVLWENAANWLLAQCDTGSFQIENPSGAEVPAASGTLRLEAVAESPLGQTVRLSGEFPPLNWAGEGNFLLWTAEFFLPLSRPEIRLSLQLDWKGESTRVRLCLPTEIDCASGTYEVPFGVARRKPYSPRANAKGEWPAQRFVAMEDTRHGIALVNTGIGGVEVGGGSLYTTLLRAPRVEYAGMVGDSTSSQHGFHDYEFSILPYARSWTEAGVVQAAQERNNPLVAVLSPGVPDAELTGKGKSFLRLEPGNVVLSGVKAAFDGSGDVMVRVYETAGRETVATLDLAGLQIAYSGGQVSLCDLRESPQSDLTADAAGVVRLPLRPFQIATLRIKR